MWFRFGDDEDYIISGEGSAAPPTATEQIPAGTQGGIQYFLFWV